MTRALLLAAPPRAGSAEEVRRAVRDALAEVVAPVCATETAVLVVNRVSYDPSGPVGSLGRISEHTRTALATNLAVLDVATEHDVAIVDADRVVAELGGGAHIDASGRWSPELIAALHDEIAHALADGGTR